jgi:hypothetical protein
LRYDRDLTLWWLTFWSATIPFAALLVMIRRTAVRFVAPGAAMVITLALGFGTVITPYAANLFGHVLAAALAFGAWILLEGGRESRARLAVSGLLVGTGVTVEYQVGIIALVLLVAAFVLVRRRAWWFVLGAVPPALVLGFYQWRAFGAPWRLPFGYFAGTINGTNEGGYSIPGARGFFDVLFSGRGLLFASPLVLVGMVAAVAAARAGDRTARLHGWIALPIVAAYVGLVAGWSGTPTLETPGPRYLAPLVPFLAVPLCVVWTRWKRLIVGTAVWGAIVQLAATVAGVAIGQNEPLLHAYVPRISGGHFVPTVWSISIGEAGILLYLVTVAAAIWFVVRSESAQYAA